jgi:hypothetical protein
VEGDEVWAGITGYVLGTGEVCAGIHWKTASAADGRDGAPHAPRQVSCHGNGDGRPYHDIGYDPAGGHGGGLVAPAARVGAVLTVIYDPGRGSLEFVLDGTPLGVACRGAPPEPHYRPSALAVMTVCHSIALVYSLSYRGGRKA